MKQIVGNIFDIQADAICCTTNGVVKSNGDLVMGRGIAREFNHRYPGLATHWGNLVAHKGNIVHLAVPKIEKYFSTPRGSVRNPEYKVLVSFPTKHHWKDKSDLALIKRSAEQLVEWSNFHYWQTILLPRPGCANGSLDWKDVEPVISQILDDRFTVVTL